MTYKGTKVLAFLSACSLFLSQSCIAFAGTPEENIEAHKALPVQSNEIANWPKGPEVAAESAIVMEASTGAILYEKNIHTRQYPASTTKILTTLIASEECELTDIVDFSHRAVFSIPAGSNNIAIDEGEQLNMEECLNAILIRSANEVCYAVAEHISGSFEAFADKMNQRAKELGCVDSHFVNPNGLPDENHYTSAYDLAMIGKAFFANELLCNITLTPMLHIEPSDRQPDDILDANKMALLPGKEYGYEYLVGCKTGYTDVSRSTLVSCAEKDGMRLICVVLNDENPNYYEDTISLFQYGFANFDKVNISQTETKYNIEVNGFSYSDKSIFGSATPLLSIDKEDSIILPKAAKFSDAQSEISYDMKEENEAAVITYRYHDVFIGSASIHLLANTSGSNTFDSPDGNTDNTDAAYKSPGFLYINVLHVLGILVLTGAAVGILVLIRLFFKNYQFSSRSTRRSWRRSRRKRNRRLPK